MRCYALLLLIVITIFCTSCARKNTGIYILKDMGVKHIVITGNEYFECSWQDYYVATTFKAKSKSGYKVTGKICSNLIINERNKNE